MRRKVTGNLKLVHEKYGVKSPHVLLEDFKQEFADAIAYNDEIDKHFNKVRPPRASVARLACCAMRHLTYPCTHVMTPRMPTLVLT